MRKLVVLAILSLILAFTSGYLVISVQQGLKSNIKPSLIESELNRFMMITKSISQIDPSLFEVDLIDPQQALPHFDQYERLELKALQSLEVNCLKIQIKISPRLQKAVQFFSTLCEKKSFSSDFFLRSPFLLPDGVSFAKKALDLGLKSDEIYSHLHWVEIKELSDVDLQVRTVFKIIKSLSWRNLNQIHLKNYLVLSPDGVLVRNDNLDGENFYSLYELNQWDVFWGKTAFKATDLSTTVQSNCFRISEDICWKVNYSQAIRYEKTPVYLILASVLLVTLVMFILLIIEVLRNKKDQEKIKFSLDMLTHELRTPLTNLNFSIDSLRNNFDTLPVDAQLRVLDILNQVNKLNILAQKSTYYLSKSKMKILATHKVSVANIHNFIESTLDAYLHDLKIEVPVRPVSFEIDIFWTGFCLKNLVENAIKHGVKPVIISYSLTDQGLQFVIRDAGMSYLGGQDQSKSKGLGLGLSLVQKVLPLINAELITTYKPTIHQLILKKKI